MQKLPTNRHSTVSALRREILEYLRSRDSEHLAMGAQRALASLAEACKKGGTRRKIYDLYGECRFAFKEALRTWPANTEATAGLTQASTLVVEHELGRDPRVANALLDEAHGITPELAERVRRAARVEAEERAGLSRLAHDHDPVVGRRRRAAVIGFLGLTWTVSQLVGDRFGPQTHERFALGGAVQLPLLAAAWFLTRGRARNLFNLRIFGALGMTFIAQCMLFAATWRLGIDVTTTRILQIGLGTVIASGLALLLEKKLWPMAFALGVAFGVSLAWPQLRSVVAALAMLGVTANVAAIWSRRA